MKTTMEKYEIIKLKLKGWSTRRISKEFGVARDTISKYWREYQTNLSLLLDKDPSINTHEIIESIVSEPTYDVSNRKSRKYNEEIDYLLDKILDDEKKKKERLGPNKQMLTKSQIHELIKAEGFDIGLTTISLKINEKRNKTKECFIKQEYEYGQRFEYDFGEVKLVIDGKDTKGFIAVLTAPASGYRWAYLYHNSKMSVFLDSQARFFEMLGGCFKQGVYDNMKNVVTKFIGRNEKQLNEQLIKLALYYGFEINVTNCFSGNEKGNVEEAVKHIRNKVFAIKYEFKSFKEAEDYLQQELIKLNKDSLIEEEKKCLTAYRPKYETAEILSCHVDKYSFIQIDTNFYSVPDSLVDKYVTVKLYPNDLYIYYKQNLVTNHSRVQGKKKTCIDINHYLSTFKRKPGALRNSSALNSVPELKFLYTTYFKDNPKELIDLLSINKDKTLDEVINLIKEVKSGSSVRVQNEIENKTTNQLLEISSLFIGGQHVYH